jgi:hypothetical protein
MERFYVGLHQPSQARHFARCMVSVHRLARRQRGFPAREWMLDSGAFSEVALRGGYRHSPQDYAGKVVRWAAVGRLVAAVSQDWMCEPVALARTGLTVADHQWLTIDRYDQILRALYGLAFLLPVVQGYAPEEYARHVRAYGDRLAEGAWVGVGSLCKRNADPRAILTVLHAVKAERPDLRLHGFGVKATSLADQRVRDALWSADSMAWSFAARYEGRDANDWREAKAYLERWGLE